MIEVIAKKIDYTHIHYECPFCSTIGKRQVDNKKKYNTMKPTIHRHGSGGNTADRTEHRSSHCLYNKEDVLIIIDKSTIRENK